MWYKDILSLQQILLEHMSTMQVILIFLISLASAFGGLALWKVSRQLDAKTRQSIFSYLRKRLIYQLVFRRRKGTSDISLFALLNILLLIAANITACTLKIANSAELAKRCGTAFIINAVPLYFGGRTNLLADRVLRFPLTEYHLLHRWIGRICVLQGLVHGIISARLSSSTIDEASTRLHGFHGTPASFRLTGIYALSFLAALGVFSFLYARRYLYEVFLKTHLLFAVALAGTLWFHVHLEWSRAAMCLGAASALWILQHIAWLVRLIYRNTGSVSSLTDATFTSFPSYHGSLQAIDATVTLKKQWKVSPGQYVYLTLPGIARHKASFMQSHPYMIAWVDGSDVTLLIQRGGGFSDTLFSSSIRRSSVLLDGPYGNPMPLDGYDKVLFFASGIGIAAHLLSVKHLINAHIKKSARIRRLTLVWFLETLDQEEWASHYLHRLRDMDQREVFILALYVPKPKSKDSRRPPSKEMTERWLRTEKHLDIREYIEGEGGVEAGNMAIAVCGPPSFEETVRRGVRSSSKDIHLFTAGFRPDETNESRMSRSRYK